MNYIQRIADKINESIEKNIDESSFNFDRYEWKDGSITGNGLVDLINDTEKWNSKTNAIKIYDRDSNKWYNIVDAHVDSKNTGIVLEINSKVESNGKENLMESNNSKWSRNFKFTKELIYEMSKEGNIGINQYGINLIVENVGIDDDFPNVEIELRVDNDGSVSVNRAFVGKNHNAESSIGELWYNNSDLKNVPEISKNQIKDIISTGFFSKVIERMNELKDKNPRISKLYDLANERFSKVSTNSNIIIDKEIYSQDDLDRRYADYEKHAKSVSDYYDKKEYNGD